MFFCRTITTSALIAPKARLQFWILHTHRNILLWTLLWCKGCTIRFDSFEISQISILGRIRCAQNRVFCRAITPSAFIAPRGRLHFWILHTLRYLLVWTLLWCKGGTILFDSFEVSQISILGRIRCVWNLVICRAITPSAFIAPSGRLHLWILHTVRYLLV